VTCITVVKGSIGETIDTVRLQEDRAVVSCSHVAPRPDCLLAHDLLNKLSIILAECGLLRWEGRLDLDAKRGLLTRIDQIEKTAKQMTTAILDRKCPLRNDPN
jgi:hypothetical protein